MSKQKPAVEPIHVRVYGTTGPSVFLLHGGPGAPGYMAPLARQLADEFQVIEPFQRASGDVPITVATHVADVHALIQATREPSPVIVGHSWGAMLALAYAAAHPNETSPLVLIGCGTFDPAARERLKAVRAERMTHGSLALQVDRAAKQFDPDRRLKLLGRLYQRIDSVDLIRHQDESAAFDARAHDETWADMLRLQDAGVYPAAFAAIRAPVLMLHGADDPHPGAMIRDSLSRYLPQLEYHELTRCGHYPWLERAARGPFASLLHRWLASHARQAAHSNICREGTP